MDLKKYLETYQVFLSLKLASLALLFLIIENLKGKVNILGKQANIIYVPIPDDFTFYHDYFVLSVTSSSNTRSELARESLYRASLMLFFVSSQWVEHLERSWLMACSMIDFS